MKAKDNTVLTIERMGRIFGRVEAKEEQSFNYDDLFFVRLANNSHIRHKIKKVAQETAISEGNTHKKYHIKYEPYSRICQVED